MTRNQSRAQLRLNTELKKAVHSSDEYEDYMALVQFLVKQKTILALRLSRIIEQLEWFEASGGSITHDPDLKCTSIQYMDLEYTVEYRDDGSVSKYTVVNPDNQVAVEYVHKIFFCAYIRPMYSDKIDLIDEQLADIDNDNVLKGIGEIRKSIRGDKYLTTAAISGASIQSEEDIDPYNIFGGDE